jgi:hypothetical protein
MQTNVMFFAWLERIPTLWIYGLAILLVAVVWTTLTQVSVWKYPSVPLDMPRLLFDGLCILAVGRLFWSGRPGSLAATRKIP